MAAVSVDLSVHTQLVVRVSNKTWRLLKRKGVQFVGQPDTMIDNHMDSVTVKCYCSTNINIAVLTI